MKAPHDSHKKPPPPRPHEKRTSRPLIDRVPHARPLKPYAFALPVQALHQDVQYLVVMNRARALFTSKNAAACDGGAGDARSSKRSWGGPSARLGAGKFAVRAGKCGAHTNAGQQTCGENDVCRAAGQLPAAEIDR
jgi:hypothetical protein